MINNFNEIYNIEGYKLKSKIYIPTFKHRKDTIIDYVKNWDNVFIMTDQEDYDANYKDFPIEKTIIVDLKDRSQYNKRKICCELAKKNNEWYFVLDDDVCETVKIYDHTQNKPKKIDLYTALCIWEKFAMANNMPVTGPGMDITVGHFNEKTHIISKPNSTLNACFLIDSSKVDPNWWTTDRSIAEDCYFTYNCLINDVDTRRIQFFSVNFRNNTLKKSLTLTDATVKLKFIVDTFLACKGYYCIKMTKKGELLTLFDSKTHFDEYDKFKLWKETNPNNYPNMVLDYYKNKNAR